MKPHQLMMMAAFAMAALQQPHSHSHSEVITETEEERKKRKQREKEEYYKRKGLIKFQFTGLEGGMEVIEIWARNRANANRKFKNKMKQLNL